MSQTGLMKKLIVATLAMIVGVACAGSATEAAQTVEGDFSGGTHDGTELFAGALALSQDVDLSETFDGTALPAGTDQLM